MSSSDPSERTARVRVEDIGTGLPGLIPRFDPVFDYLVESAASGRLDVWYAAIPRNAILPFDPEYAPRKHPVGEAAVREVMSRGKKGEFAKLWVYQRGQVFVMSDDYIVWEAAREGQPDYLPCWVLGRPEHSRVVDLQGPLDHPSVLQLLGFA